MEFVKFTPGEYLDFEREAVQVRLDIAAGKAEMPAMGGPFRGREPKPYTTAEILAYNKKWDPYNPLFNDPEYAKKAGYADIPAYPGFCMAMAMGAPGFDTPRSPRSPAPCRMSLRTFRRSRPGGTTLRSRTARPCLWKTAKRFRRAA